MDSETDAEAIEKLEKRIEEQKGKLLEAKNQGRRKDAEAIELYIEFLRRKYYYHKDGPWQIDSVVDEDDLEETIEKRKGIVEELKEFYSAYPEGMRKRELVKIIDEQETKLRFLEIKSAHRKGIITDAEYAKKVEDLTTGGLKINFTPNEYSILSNRYYKESERKTAPTPLLPKVERRTLVIGVTVVILLISIYFGGAWRQVPNGPAITGNYQIAREHFIKGNDYYTRGDYARAMTEYGKAATHFSKSAGYAEDGVRKSAGNMAEYLGLKKDFYSHWTLVSLEMKSSSEAYMNGDVTEAIRRGVRAEELAAKSIPYNQEANTLWKSLW
jgi:hypothetical protein